jgi:hypothetical protein
MQLAPIGRDNFTRKGTERCFRSSGPDFALARLSFTYGESMLADEIYRQVLTIHIFERKPIPDLGVLPDSAAGYLLPQCQVVIL